MDFMADEKYIRIEIKVNAGSYINRVRRFTHAICDAPDVSRFTVSAFWLQHSKPTTRGTMADIAATRTDGPGGWERSK